MQNNETGMSHKKTIRRPEKSLYDQIQIINCHSHSNSAVLCSVASVFDLFLNPPVCFFPGPIPLLHTL